MLQIASPPGKGGVISKPARMVDDLGKSLVGDAVAGNDNQFGPVVLVEKQHCLTLQICYGNILGINILSRESKPRNSCSGS